MLLGLPEDQGAVFVEVRPVRDLDTVIAGILDTKALQTDYFDRLEFGLTALAEDDDIFNLEPVHIHLVFPELYFAHEFQFDWCLHVAGLAVLHRPYFSVEGRVVALEEFLVRLDPVAEVLVAEAGLAAALDVNVVVIVDLEGEIFDQRAHIAILDLVLELVLVDLQVGALVVVLQQCLVGEVEGSGRFGVVFRLEGIELVHIVLQLDIVVAAQLAVSVVLHRFVLQQNFLQLFF